MQAVPALYHPLHLDRLEQLDQEVKSKIYDELHNAKKVPFIFPMLETQDREQRKFGIRTVLSLAVRERLPGGHSEFGQLAVHMMELDPKDEALLSETFKVPKVTQQRFQRLGSGPAADGSGVPFLGVFRIKSGGTLARILKNAMGPWNYGR
nr:hypothetical protein pPsy0462a_00058 [Pseudomonas syringae]